ncbi:MAG: hypothetical protein OYI31_03070 [Chloroflexota bacterium]|nr:hypothetical protein [Chloroflexota bacterium]MDE2941047.1 hypothetical protein [Chloroflexota bacterium]MDE3267427.1 hypothetical protein [Chloroflexota bacterium]
MTIRRLRTTDLLWYLIDGPRLGPSLAQTWDRVGKSADSPPSPRSVAGGLALHRERERGSVLTEGLHLRALASVRTRSGPKAWEVHLLNLPPEIEHEGIELLEGLCALAGEQGGERVFLRLPALNRVVDLAREAGFVRCTQETLYSREALPPAEQGDESAIRQLEPSDAYQVFLLYDRCVPSRVKWEYAMTFDEWSHALESPGKRVRQGVYEVRGSVRGWARVGSGRQSVNSLEAMMHPSEDEAAWDTLVSWALRQGRSSAPFLSLVPSHQPEQARALERADFVPVRQYQLMVKPLAVRVKERAFAPARA